MSAPAPDVTVAICTWNRCESLRRTLLSLTRMHPPDAADWELLVVDNASTDATSEVAASFGDRLPVRIVGEPRPGIAHARNRAVREARGRHVAWTDDDVVVDEAWLRAYVRAFRRWPDASIFGGPIAPEFEGRPPAWIPRILSEIGPVFGLQDLGDEPVRLSAATVGEGPYGANMAARREAHLRFPFDANLGARHGAYAIGEETEALRQMLRAGLEGWWTPEPRVKHRVPRENQTVAYVRRWMVGCGRYIARFPERDPSLPTHDPTRLLYRLVRHEVRFRVGRLIAPPEVWIRDLIRAGHAQGRLAAGRKHPERRGSAGRVDPSGAPNA